MAIWGLRLCIIIAWGGMLRMHVACGVASKMLLAEGSAGGFCLQKARMPEVVDRGVTLGNGAG